MCGQSLDDALLVAACVDGRDLDLRVGFHEVGRKTIDRLGNRASDSNGVEKLHLNRCLRLQLASSTRQNDTGCYGLESC